jgi:CelD/BcsL family acetyltransferase involved in cellulose biosynthesis
LEKVDVRIIRDLPGLARLEVPWTTLAKQPGVRPFQEFGWASAWARTIGTTGGRRLHVATLWQAERLVALFPLVLRRYSGVRMLEWLGAKASDYCDALVLDSESAEAALNALWRELLDQGGFDVARLGQVRTDAHTYGTLSTSNPWIETREQSVGIDIVWPSGDAWLASHTGKSREPITRRLRRMVKMGFEFHVLQRGEPHGSVIDAVIAQKTAWLQERGLENFLTAPQGPAFLRAAAEELIASGSLHLSVVRSKERIAACHLGFMRDGVLYYYMPTYDPEWAKCGFGTLQRDALLMWACDQGLRRFDLLLGTHDYKTRYPVTPEELHTLVVPRGIIGRAAVCYYRCSTKRARAAR